MEGKRKAKLQKDKRPKRLKWGYEGDEEESGKRNEETKKNKEGRDQTRQKGKGV